MQRGNWDLSEIGKLLRSKRREQGLTQEALADDNISPSTISLIERGIPNVHPDKVAYLAGKLGIDLGHAPRLLDDKKEQEKEILARLKFIENTVDMVDPSLGIEKLNKIPLDVSPHVAAYTFYLKGRCFLKRKSWNKAHNHFNETIRIIDKNPELETTNFKARAFYELGRTCYYQNDLENAFHYVNKGIQCFQEKGERKYLRYNLLISKAIYLEKMDRLLDSLNVLNSLWEETGFIKNIHVILNMYETKALILKKLKQYDEAIHYAVQGIELARINGIHERSLDLWTALGSIYLQLGDFKEAESCFLEALEMKERIKNEYLFVNSYSELGILYLKMGKIGEAISKLETAVQLGRKTNDALRLTKALIYLGDCHSHQKSYSKAYDIYKEAHELSHQHQFAHLQKDIVLRLVQCCQHIDKEHYPIYLDELVRLELILQQNGS
jgi:tetratricopeptide (TPR) repeat protein/DNA-binding XRE family transcriptional regulator